MLGENHSNFPFVRTSIPSKMIDEQRRFFHSPNVFCDVYQPITKEKKAKKLRIMKSLKLPGLDEISNTIQQQLETDPNQNSTELSQDSNQQPPLPPKTDSNPNSSDSQPIPNQQVQPQQPPPPPPKTDATPNSSELSQISYQPIPQVTPNSIQTSQIPVNQESTQWFFAKRDPIQIPDDIQEKCNQMNFSKIIGILNANLNKNAPKVLDLIRIMRNNQNELRYIIQEIVKQFVLECKNSKLKQKNNGLSYALSRIVSFSHIGDNGGLNGKDFPPPPFGMFLREFGDYIPWLIDPLPNDLTTDMDVFHLLLLWFSYDERAIRHLSIPIVHRILNQLVNNLSSYGELIECFFETTSYCAQQFCPELFRNFCQLLERKLNECKASKSYKEPASIHRINEYLEKFKQNTLSIFPPRVKPEIIPAF